MKLRDNWTIRAAVIGWLRYDRHCHLVCYERSPLGDFYYRPDIIGVTRSRKIVEVEVKKTMSDFRANARKPAMRNGWFEYRVTRPYQFYFAVDPKIADAVKQELPDGAGLLTLSANGTKYGPSIQCLKGAPINRESPRLTIEQIIKMVSHQTGSLHRAAVALSIAQQKESQ